MRMVYWLLLKDFCQFFGQSVYFWFIHFLPFFICSILTTKKNAFKTTSPAILQSSDWSPTYSLLHNVGYLLNLLRINISAIFLSFCSSLSLATLLAWRLLKKARTWAWTTYSFHSLNFSDRKGSCWHRKRENMFVKNFCFFMLSWTRCWSPLVTPPQGSESSANQLLFAADMILSALS